MKVSGKTKILGVFGHPVSHSLSPVMHNAAIEALNIDYIYVPFHVLPENLGLAVDGIRGLNLAGVNVTIPHKEQVIKYLDEVSDYAMQIRSVNTIINDNGRLIGDTTDGPGFLKSAEAAWGSLDNSRVLILGAGGSAKAVGFALARIGCHLLIANRTKERAEELSNNLSAVFGREVSKVLEMNDSSLASEMEQIDILINTTSVGMHPDIDSIPISPSLLRPGLKVYDLIYNPAKTKLVLEAEARGAQAITGLNMLVYQGALSFEMWTGIAPPVDAMEMAVAKALEQ